MLWTPYWRKKKANKPQLKLERKVEMTAQKASTSDAANVKKNELYITRIFDAPLELVWQAFTDPDKMMLWWGPKTYTTPVLKMDFRVGGKYLYCMRSPEGQDYWGAGVVREIVDRKRIVYTDSFADEKGNIVQASHYGMAADMPLELLVTLTFEEFRNGKTRLTLRHAGLPEGEMSEGTAVGWNESFDKLAAFLMKPKSEAKSKKTKLIAEPGKQEIIVTRTFDAPRALVFKAYTDPKLIPQWWGPRRYTTKVEMMEVRPGGRWRFVQGDASGNEFGFHGVFHELSAPQRIVQTFEYEGTPGHVLLETATFEEQDGKTILTSQSVFQSVADRDGMLNSGMEGGEDESMERLDELLAKAEKAK
jgi:uncharacterized protein YndB with AHSA1/START domain